MDSPGQAAVAESLVRRVRTWGCCLLFVLALAALVYGCVAVYIMATHVS